MNDEVASGHVSNVQLSVMAFVCRSSAGFNSELLQDVTNVLLYRPATDSENHGNLSVALPFDDPVHDFPLAPGEPRARGGSLRFR